MRVWVSVIAALLMWIASAGSAHAADPATPYHKPKAGNQYVAVTKTKLFVVWSLPRDLGPVAHLLGDRERLEAFIGRTAIHMCAEHRAARHVELPCKFQIVRLKSNDEYSKSASGGFSTLGKLQLPAAKATAETLQQSLKMDAKQIRALFERFDLAFDRFKR